MKDKCKTCEHCNNLGQCAELIMCVRYIDSTNCAYYKSRTEAARERVQQIEADLQRITAQAEAVKNSDKTKV